MISLTMTKTNRLMIYVDDMYKHSIGRFRLMKMSHMIADDHDELIDFAKRIGLNAEWIQKEGTHFEHFDVSISMRKKAVAAGAVEITYRQLGNIMFERGKK